MLAKTLFLASSPPPDGVKLITSSGRIVNIDIGIHLRDISEFMESLRYSSDILATNLPPGQPDFSHLSPLQIQSHVCNDEDCDDVADTPK